MLVKALVFTALVTSTPIAILATQDPQQTPQSPAEVRRQNVDLAQLRQELDAARADLHQVRAQLEQALDALDRSVEPPRRDNNSCSQSRSRALMSHYQWLKDQGHSSRAAGALTKLADQVGDDVNRLNGAAWDLMTDKNTAGKFDEIALALAQRMAVHPEQLQHHHLDTMALAHFLNGGIDRAIELQQQAIDRGGNGDDYRRRLRTYEAARAAVAAHQEIVTTQERLVAASND